jgi:hypothetical protein
VIPIVKHVAIEGCCGSIHEAVNAGIEFKHLAAVVCMLAAMGCVQISAHLLAFAVSVEEGSCLFEDGDELVRLLEDASALLDGKWFGLVPPVERLHFFLLFAVLFTHFLLIDLEFSLSFTHLRFRLPIYDQSL